MNNKKIYKQYYTPDSLAAFMVKSIPRESINTIIDLSMGECGLLEKSRERWEDANCYGADIDEDLINSVKESSPYIITYRGDSLNCLQEWEEYNTIIKAGGFELALANPPFDYTDQRYISMKSGEVSKVPIEICFLYKYLDIIKEDGYICIILPLGFLTNDKYVNIRKDIMSSLEIVKIIKIFKGCFNGIDADTCLLLLHKINNEEQHLTELGVLDSEYQLIDRHEVNLSTLLRWDLDYYLLQQNKIFPNEGNVKKFSVFIQECRRGISKTCESMQQHSRGKRFIHTTDVKQLYISKDNCVHVKRNKAIEKKCILHENDILIGRVGKGCLGKVAIISKKYSGMYFSDCLFSISVTGINPYYCALFWSTKYGQKQFRDIAKGSCSKYITYKDLMNLDIYVPDKCIQDNFGDCLKSIMVRPGRKNRDRVFSNIILELENFIAKG